MIYIKTHQSENGSVVAMCDKTLINEVLEEGDVLIDIKTYSGFYNGELVEKGRALEIIANTDKVYSANIVGSESVEIGLKAGLIEKSSVMKVKKIPYAQAYRVNI